MKRHAFIFLGTFIAGAALTFVARAAMHEPHAGHAETVAADATPPAVAPPAASHGTHGGTTQTPSAGDTAKPAADDSKPVNTVCAICGMKVNPKIPTETYQGKKVGFGCGGCPATFRAHPDKYGPAALRNEVVEE